MKIKAISLILSITAILVLMLGFSSAYYAPSETNTYKYTTYKSYDSNYNPRYSSYTNYDKTTTTTYLPYGGKATKTTYVKETVDSPKYDYYGSYYPNYMYNTCYGCSQNWRYTPSYSYGLYGTGDSYGYDYYYKPKVNYLGYYNWRY